MNRVWINCGAHMATSYVYFKQVFPEANTFNRIVCFEANPEFKSYFENLSDVEFHNVAVWTYDGKIDFYNNHRGSSTVLLGKAQRNGITNNRETVPCIDFSFWLKNNVAKDDHVVVSVDIEGAEYDVFEKLFEDKTIDLIDEVFIELHQRKTNNQISPERHVNLIENLLNVGLVPWAWAANENLERNKEIKIFERKLAFASKEHSSLEPWPDLHKRSQNCINKAYEIASEQGYKI